MSWIQALFGGDPLDGLIYLIFALVAVTISLVLHELAHGLVAKWNGDYTAKYAGRLTLNPLKHFDPIGFIMMLFVGFGYAKPVPVNPYNFKKRTLGMVTVALAGIITNIILAFVSSFFYILMLFAYRAAWQSGSAESVINLCVYLAEFFQILMSINLSLAFFNILPIFPLDGFRVIESFTKHGNKFCAFMRVNGQYILYGLVGLSFIVSTAGRYASLPYWFQYIDILGTYLRYTSGGLGWCFTELWSLIFF